MLPKAILRYDLLIMPILLIGMALHRSTLAQDGTPNLTLISPLIEGVELIEALGLLPDHEDSTLIDAAIVEVNAALLAALDRSMVPLEAMPVVTLRLMEAVEFDVKWDDFQPQWIEIDPGQNEPNGTLLSGRIVGGPLGDEKGHVVLLKTPDGVFASMHLDGVGSYRVQPGANGVHVALKVESGMTAPFCEVGEDDPPLAEAPEVPEEPAGADSGSFGPESTCGACDDGCTIDLIVLWTSTAETEAGGAAAMRSQVLLAVADANAAYRNSQIAQTGDPPMIRR
jgi:hypothetical protein